MKILSNAGYGPIRDPKWFGRLLLVVGCALGLMLLVLVGQWCHNRDGRAIVTYSNLPASEIEALEAELND